MEDQNAKELHEERTFLHEQDEVLLEGEELTVADRILYVVTAPKRAFSGLQNVRLGSVISISLLMAIIFGVGSSLLMFSSAEVVDQMKQKQVEPLEERLEDPSFTSEQKEQIEKQIELISGMSATQYLMGGLFAIILGIPIVALLVALLIFVIAKVIEEGRETNVRFVDAFAVSALAGIVSGIGGFVGAVLIRITENPGVQIGLSGFIQADSKIIGAVLGLLNLPYIWWMIVIGIGIAVIARSSIAKSTLIFFSSVLVIAALLGLVAQQLGAAFGF